MGNQGEKHRHPSSRSGLCGEQARGNVLRLGEKSLPASPFDMLRASCFTKGRGSRGREVVIEVFRKVVMQKWWWRAG